MYTIMMDVLKWDFCEIHIYDCYLVVMINEGDTILQEHNTALCNLVDIYFKNKDFVYISHRIHSYAIDPAIHFETSKIKNLKGYAVVSKSVMAKSSTEIEKLFLKIPLKTFDELKDAVSWAKSILKQ